MTGRAGGEGFVDPYVYPGSTVLRNLLGKTTQSELGAVEYLLTFDRRVELDRNPITGPFDSERLKETHRRLFQDIYDWAGKVRTVEISKAGSAFHQAARIPTAAEQTFDWMRQTRLLDPAVDDESFVVDAADLMEKLNYIHPFREGNGRTQRAFLDQVAAVSGKTLSWRNVSPADQLRAAVNSFNDASGEPFQSVIKHALRTPIDGLSPLDSELYTARAPVTGPGPDSGRDDVFAERYRRFPELRGIELDAPGALSPARPRPVQSRGDDEPQLG